MTHELRIEIAREKLIEAAYAVDDANAELASLFIGTRDKAKLATLAMGRALDKLRIARQTYADLRGGIRNAE